MQSGRISTQQQNLQQYINYNIRANRYVGDVKHFGIYKKNKSLNIDFVIAGAQTQLCYTFLDVDAMIKQTMC